MIKKILIANRGEIAGRVIKTARKPFVISFAMCGVLLTSCVTVNTDIVEGMSSQAWQDIITKKGISDDEFQTTRFEDITRKVVAASNLPNESWDIKVFNGTSPDVFSLAGNRLGASDDALNKLSDNRIANLAAYSVATVELKQAEQRIANKKLGGVAGSLASLASLGTKETEAQKSRRTLLKDLGMSDYVPPPTPKMRAEALARAKDIVEKAGFTLDMPATQSGIWNIK